MSKRILLVVNPSYEGDAENPPPLLLVKLDELWVRRVVEDAMPGIPLTDASLPEDAEMIRIKFKRIEPLDRKRTREQLGRASPELLSLLDSNGWIRIGDTWRFELGPEICHRYAEVWEDHINFCCESVDLDVRYWCTMTKEDLESL